MENNNELNTNDESVKRYPHLMRQLSLIDVKRLNSQKVFVIGCGAIGSFAVLALTKMGITNIEVWDNDEVDVVNMSTQFFREQDIGKNKAIALQNLIRDFNGVEIKANPCLFELGTGYHKFSDAKNAIVISAVDSMTVRKAIFDEIIESELTGISHIIDPRMSAETYMQICCDLSDQKSIDNYRKTLYSDANSVQERCTAKSTIYTVLGSGCLIVKTIKNILMTQTHPKYVSWDIANSNNDTFQMFGNK